jgi:PIN domain nuclease of toxin-antitoxin system
MRLLLDTHILLWALREPERLGAAVRDVIEDPTNEVLFSAASIWEVAIKARLRRHDFDAKPEEIARAARAARLTELPIWSDAAALVASLPLHHRDPFDRLLVAQAMAEPLHLYTADRQLSPYSDLVVFVA